MNTGVRQKTIPLLFFLPLLMLTSPVTFAINNHIETTRANLTEGEHVGKIIPYGFYNADTGLALASVFIGKGYLQDQVLTIANVWASQNGSYQFFLANSDALLPFSNRIFFDSAFMYTNWETIDTYQSGNPAFPNEIAGSNESDKNNFITASGDDIFGYATLRYLLPLGDGRGDPIHTFKLENGIPLPGSEAGGGSWNPFDSGRTTFEFRPFYRDQNFEEESSGEPFRNKTAGVKLALEYNNTDWYKNPTHGTVDKLTIARDWAVLDDSTSWTAIQFRHSQFFSLGETAKARQRVLALSVWASDVPTWNSTSNGNNSQPIFHRPPLFEGSTLGGLERQRAYPGFRFHDRSAINYSVEYRYTPKWNPLSKIPLIKSLYIPWWQWVAYAEVGRVASRWNVKELHKKMKSSVGGSLRVMVYELVIRLDVGTSEEGGEIQMFFNHPF